MMDDFIRDLHHLQKADSLIGKIWLKLFARQFGLFAFAGLIAALGFTMTNIAGFYGLQAPLGPVWAAVVVAIGDFILAAVVVQAARNSEPGPEMALALDTRKMAIEAIQADARHQDYDRHVRSGHSGYEGRDCGVCSESVGRHRAEPSHSCGHVDHQRAGLKEGPGVRKRPTKAATTSEA